MMAKVSILLDTSSDEVKLLIPFHTGRYPGQIDMFKTRTNLSLEQKKINTLDVSSSHY